MTENNRIYPPWVAVKNFREPLTEGENYLAQFLDKNLPKDWNIYFSSASIELLQYYNSIMDPINCYLIEDKDNNNINLETIIIKEITNISENTMENTQGTEICIPYDDKILIISGIIKKDSINIVLSYA